MEEFDHLKIQLEDIILATDSFASNKLIGRGGFGSVYRGELSRPEGLKAVACKRLDRRFGQGNVEFLKEILMLSKYKHENLVSLLHFCIEGDERILVYEYAPRGSLDGYLSDPTLTWTQRLKICIGAAQALNYLHDPLETYQRVLHRDIKSANILLDDEWNAKVSDFGLSKISPANQVQSYMFSNVVGTPGYCDPLYFEMGILSKESDVYSFGVVLFEVMCGKICFEYRDGRLLGILVPKWKKCFEEKRLDDIIGDGLKNMEPGSLNTFSNIAYQCLKAVRNERPTMSKIVEELKIALEQQEVFDDIGKRTNFEVMRRIADLAVSPLSYVTQSQLLMLFMKGVLVDHGKTWVSINEKGQHYELISALKCISTSDTDRGSSGFVERRSGVFYRYVLSEYLRLAVGAQFLSPNVTYIINLVYHCDYLDYNDPNYHDKQRIPFKYKLEETRQYSTSCVADIGKDRWLRTELFQFTSTEEEHYFDIRFSSQEMFGKHESIAIKGIEFCPVDFENDENKVEMQPEWGRIVKDDPIRKVKLQKDMESMTVMEFSSILHKGINFHNSQHVNMQPDWMKILLDGTISMVKLSKDIDSDIDSMTLKEFYFLLRKGIYLNNSQQWLSISKKSIKRLMLPARAILREEKRGWNFLSRREKSWQWKSLAGSRFKEVAECCDINHIDIRVRIDSQLLSHDMVYACYLVFKLPHEEASVFEGIVVTKFTGWSSAQYMYLVTPPHTPIIVLSPADERPSRTRKIKGHPKLRKDGWMEIQVWKSYHGSSVDPFRLDGYIRSLNEWNFTGLLVQGFELRPAKVSFDNHRVQFGLY